MINGLLRKYLKEYIENQGFLVYHGSPTKIAKFSDEFVSGEKSNDAEGPGIYTTNIYNDARQYGNNIYTLKLSPRKLLTEAPINKLTYNISSVLKKLIKMIDGWELTAQNWHMNPNIGLDMAIKSFIEYNDNEKDVFLQVWVDFYGYSNGISYIRDMVTLGIDGVLVDKKDFERFEGFKNCKHIIIYNPSIIEVRDVEFNTEENDKKF
jgi:hypothetical protein